MVLTQFALWATICGGGELLVSRYLGRLSRVSDKRFRIHLK